MKNSTIVYIKPSLRKFSLLRVLLLSVICGVLFFAETNIVSAQDENEVQSRAVEIFNRGQDAHQKGDLNEALKLYDQALEILPEFPEAELQKGSVLMSLGKYSAAEQSFKKASELRDDWVLPLENLAQLFLATKNFSAAEETIEKIFTLDSQNVASLVALAKIKIRSNAAPADLKTLLGRIQNTSATASSDASLYAAQAALERALGETAAAKNSLAKALALDARHVFALAESRELAFAEKNYQQAIADAQTLVKISAQPMAEKFRLAQIYETAGKSEEALKVLDELNDADQEVATLKNSIVANSSEDAAALETRLAGDAKNLVILGRLCNLLRVPNPTKALDYCRRAAELTPNDPRYAVGYGAALVRAKQFEQAVGLFRRILQIAPENYVARANLATALFELKMFAAAANEYEWIIRSNPDLAIANYFLAISYDQVGEYPKALESYQQFLRLADAKANKLEIDRVTLRLPAVEKLSKQKGKRE